MDAGSASTKRANARGPLTGLRILELGGIGPAPFACMMLADHGAEVIRVDRPGRAADDLSGNPRLDVLLRSRRTLVVDLKAAEGAALVRELAGSSHGLVEGFRPGVAERLGLGPQALLGDNSALVYGRMTGWGQDGPCARTPGHDINFIALAGVLHALGRAGEKPTPPINLLGDFGGGGMLLAFGMVCALLHARATGVGQVVDCAMTDGAALLMSLMWTFRAQGTWRDERGVNLLDTGAPFYDTYETSDGKFVALGAVEPSFYRRLLEVMELLDDPIFADQFDPQGWARGRDRLAARFREATRDEWCARFEGVDTCFAPVLSMAEAPHHAHNRARGTFVEVGGVMQPAPAPRFSATPAAGPTMSDGADEAVAILADFGLGADRIEDLRARGIVG